MEQNNYHSTFSANITPAQAYNDISNVAAWWAKSFKGKAQQVGDTFTVQFGDTFVAFEITEAIPERKVVWHVTDCNLHWLKNKTEWTGTSISWDIASKNGITTINMTHIGLTPALECYENCREGWDEHVLEGLFKLATTGEVQTM